MTFEQLLAELDPSRWPAGWCDEWMNSETWRQHWEINDNAESDEKLPMAWHRTGLCFQIEYDDIRWVVGTSDESASREEELGQGLGDVEFGRLTAALSRQLAVLWREHGHTDFSPHKMDPAEPWRAQWVLHAGTSAKANAVHSSGLGLNIVTDTDMGHVPVWWAIEAEHFAEEHTRLKRELGQDGFDDFLSKRRREALELWYALGSENGIGPTNQFGSPLNSSARPAPQLGDM